MSRIGLTMSTVGMVSPVDVKLTSFLAQALGLLSNDRRCCFQKAPNMLSNSISVFFKT
jgi:hypothetical protein